MNCSYFVVRNNNATQTITTIITMHCRSVQQLLFVPKFNIRFSQFQFTSSENIYSFYPLISKVLFDHFSVELSSKETESDPVLPLCFKYFLLWRVASCYMEARKKNIFSSFLSHTVWTTVRRAIHHLLKKEKEIVLTL